MHDVFPITLTNVKTCAGDAGAALVMNKKLVAINIDSHGCGENPSTEFLVTGVQAQYNWIREKIGDEDLVNAEHKAYGAENIIQGEDTNDFILPYE